MINLKPLVVSALESNQALISLLGGPRIYFMVAPDAEEFPRITYYELNNTDEDYADDDPISSTISFQISIWTKDPAQISPIALEVDQSMGNAGFYRTFTTDLFEEDTRVFHKPMRYSGKFDI
ncbi:DUF3168 domain-containing protein [Thermoactinomyces daqus]|jgi:hypothetical protein|uniref:DUF3168 domain-containing protein n=1 Tax=Thermoactinomyces daqus TaxID=1329516 RepID=A0A7W1XD53_9BACL|nr:DUF3168 domain-containing protein [Thermoactinomyces daqus]MBA4544373.1 DUF3168 domain-containing protein [Thermoactinomyces daqus]